MHYCIKQVQILHLAPPQISGSRYEEHRHASVSVNTPDGSSKASTPMQSSVLSSKLRLKLPPKLKLPSKLHSPTFNATFIVTYLSTTQFTLVFVLFSSLDSQTNPIELEGLHYHKRVKPCWYLPPPFTVCTSLTAAHDHLLCESCCAGRPPIDNGPSNFPAATPCDAGNGLAICGLTHPERTQGGSEAQDFSVEISPPVGADLNMDWDRTCTAEPCLPSHVLEV